MSDQHALAGAADGPYFFLSYARTPRSGPFDDVDPNRWVTKLFSDICADIIQLSPMSGRPGFMDLQLRTGEPWPEVGTALATCRVFVPLYSPRYFHNPVCGKEWATFFQRDSPGSQLTQAIVPALWVPIASGELPPSASQVGLPDAKLGVHYREHGFYGLMKLSRFRDHYRRAVFGLAQTILEAGTRNMVRAGKPSDYLSAGNAFDRLDGPRMI
ncbi:TIR-like protein FxsC [Sphaerisporangium aureirubrum]|uniref:TIR-like protein FxsC n=1 Tax=Sphaerisporangium aureirubrum TaxID=1544736 RepID=A0ABW1NP59_9ACTN